jgi:hypothetical protein
VELVYLLQKKRKGMLPVYIAMLQIGGIFGDLELVLKVVGLLFIISFVRSHIQHPILSTTIIVLMAGFLLFDFWKIFGGALLLYLISIFGFIHILVDLSFLQAFKEPILNVGGLFSRRPSVPPPHHDPRAGYGQQYHEEAQEEENEYHHQPGGGAEQEQQSGEIGGGIHTPNMQRLMHERALQQQRIRQQQMMRRGGKKDERHR